MKARRLGRMAWVAALVVALASCVGLAQVIINEIAWAGTAASANDEWIELHNVTDQSVDLAGWTLRIDGSVIHLGEVADATLEVRRSIIEPGGFFLLERTDDTTVSDIEADVIYTGALSNGGEDLFLINASGDTVDQVLLAESGWPAGTIADAETAYATMELLVTPFGSVVWESCQPSFAAHGLDAEGNALAGTAGAENSMVFFALQVPQLDLIAPTEGTVHGTVIVEWAAIDPDGDDARLRIMISLWDNDERVVLAENLTNAGSFAWDTTAHADGSYGLMVAAEDPLGNRTLGLLRMVDVQNET